MDRRDEAYTLSGSLELDEGFFSTVVVEEEKDKPLKRDRGSQKKSKVLVMAESTPVEGKTTKKGKPRKVGHIKMLVIDDLKSDTNTAFSIDGLAQALGMGRTVFYKKVKGITGHSPNEYLRIIRMKKAAELLTTIGLNVSEVSYRIGMNDPFYFSKCFKMQFKKSPSQYQKEKDNL